VAGRIEWQAELMRRKHSYGTAVIPASSARALPIAPREAAFAELNGVEALEQKFDAARLDYMNPARPPVV
jgi:hypothetical protein